MRNTDWIALDEPGCVEAARIVNGSVLFKLERERQAVALSTVVVGFGDIARVVRAIEQRAQESEDVAALWKISKERAGYV